MPFFQKFHRVLLMFLRGPHPYFRVFNRILVNNLEDERKKIYQKRYLTASQTLNYQNRFLQWTYQMQQKQQANNRGFKDLNRATNKRMAHSLEEVNNIDDHLEMETIFSSYEDDRDMASDSWQFEELNSSVTESL